MFENKTQDFKMEISFFFVFSIMEEIPIMQLHSMEKMLVININHKKAAYSI